MWLYGSNPNGFNNTKPAKAYPSLGYDEYSLINNSVSVLDKTGFTIIPEKSISSKYINKLIILKSKEIRWDDEIFKKMKSTIKVNCEPND
jgi:uridylate kinase